MTALVMEGKESRMPPVVTKQEFRAPADLLHEEIIRLKLPQNFKPELVAVNPLVGTWVNCNHQTRGMVRVIIAAAGKEITVHGFGACSPNPCDWGTTPGLVYAENVTATPGVAFTATYTFGFKQTIVIGHLRNGALIIETFDHFTDNSGRSDYYSQDIMVQ
jgi:hypothetical protein